MAVLGGGVLKRLRKGENSVEARESQRYGPVSRLGFLKKKFFLIVLLKFNFHSIKLIDFKYVGRSVPLNL